MDRHYQKVSEFINKCGVKAVYIPIKKGGIFGNPIFFEPVIKEKPTSHPAQ